MKVWKQGRLGVFDSLPVLPLLSSVLLRASNYLFPFLLKQHSQKCPRIGKRLGYTRREGTLFI